MITELKALEERAALAIAQAQTSGELKAVETELVGKNGSLSAFQKRLGSLSSEDKRTVGAAVNEARQRLQDNLAGKRSELAMAERLIALEQDRLDLTEFAVNGSSFGSVHPVTLARQQLEDVFVGMGFTVADGPEVEDDWHNFGALNMPPGHPARSGFDSIFVNYGETESVMMRTHTSPVQIRLMEQGNLPIYAIMPGRVFRRETPDARHLAEFHQIEGLVVDKGITLGDLAGCVDTFIKAFFGEDMNTRLRPGSFPFTEPSAELDISCAVCRGKGCRTCSETGWVELGGCGLVHPNVFRSVGIDPEQYSGFAFGFGIDRLVQMRHSVPDMRVLLDNDVRFLSQFA